ncbi:APC family permease [Priestia megaterium]|uniref:APC family permease n=1 Tax=Priestia megaterium TaxID=1404 RepID=UPI0012B6CE08|nr:APC family permease [Priestia megaterium]
MNHGPSLLKQLKLWHIVVIGLGYMAPMAVFDTFGIVTESTDGHVSGAYAFTLIAILFTAISYGKMVKAFPGAGSSYTYAQQVMNPSIGFLVGWTALLDYLFLPMINALLTNIYLSSLFPGVPKAVWIISFVVIMTIMNIFSVHLTVSFGTLLVAFQILVAIIFIILSATTQGQELSFKPFISESASISLLLNGAAILCFSFLGFDAVTTMAEETLKPEKTIPKGILIIACTGGALFITVSYFAQLLFPSASLFNDLEGASAEIAYKIGGQLFQSIFVAAALTSTIASGLVSHMSASRLLYAIGKDGYLPRRIFGYIHPKTKTPVWNVVIIGGLSLISLSLSLEKATSLINFGALIAFSSVNIAVFIHYFIQQNKRSLSGYISYVLMPLLGSLFLFFMWLNLEKTSLFIGIVWSIIGIIYLLIARRKNTITIPTFHFD